jgi:hypothetical protein
MKIRPISPNPAQQRQLIKTGKFYPAFTEINRSVSAPINEEPKDRKQKYGRYNNVQSKSLKTVIRQELWGLNHSASNHKKHNHK